MYQTVELRGGLVGSVAATAALSPVLAGLGVLDRWAFTIEVAGEMPKHPRDALVFGVIAYHAGPPKHVYYRGVEYIATVLGCSERTAQYSLRRLEADGWIVPVGHRDGGRGNATEYALVGRERVQPVAPFETERVQAGAQKGATGCTPTRSNQTVRADAPTDRQLRTLADMGRERGVTPREVRTRREASAEIERLKPLRSSRAEPDPPESWRDDGGRLLIEEGDWIMQWLEGAGWAKLRKRR